MDKPVAIAEIEDWIHKSFLDVVLKEKYGEKSFFYNRDRLLPHGIYFLTIKESDGPHDRSSNLDRADVFRVSWQLGPLEFSEKFGDKPKRPAKGESIVSAWDLTKLNTHMPHAVYGWMRWSMILSPSEKQFRLLKESISKAYKNAQEKFEKKLESL